jgi:hypothetical protein
MRPLSPTSEDVVSVGPHSSLLSLFLSLSLSLSLPFPPPAKKEADVFSRSEQHEMQFRYSHNQ